MWKNGVTIGSWHEELSCHWTHATDSLVNGMDLIGANQAGAGEAWKKLKHYSKISV